MELSTTTKAKIDQLKAEGYSTQEILAYMGAEKYGERSVIHDEQLNRAKLEDQTAANSLTWQDIAGAPAKFLAPGAVDVFGSALARRGIGTDVDTDITREYIDEPTGRQYAGAALQVGLTVGSLGAAAPATLGRNVALGAGLGYVYDVGEDLTQQEAYKDALLPGFGTAVGGLAPVAFTGLGAGFRALRPAQEAGEAVADDVGRAVAPAVRQAVGETTEEVAETAAGKTSSAIAETGQTVANRFSRAGRHLQEYADDKAARNLLRQDARPAVNLALDEGIDTRTITAIEGADDNLKGAYRQVVQVASGDDPKAAELVSGEYATEMYKIARGKQTEVGEKLGEARRALPNEPISETVYNPSLRTFKNTMQNNGIALNPDGTIEVSTLKYTDEQVAAIEKIWKRAARPEGMTPTQVDELMQYLSRLEYQTNVVDRISNVYIDVPDPKTGQIAEENIFRFIRNTYDNMLEQVDTSGQIGDLRKQYSTAKSVTGKIEDTWFRGLDINKSTDADLADRAALALRRLDSRATSRTTYGQMYRALETYARGNGYTGPDASQVSSFYVNSVEPVFTQTTPEASFRGGITGGVRSVLENVFDFGEANVKDKQRALKGLLDIDDVRVNPAATKESIDTLEQEVADLQRNIEGRQAESSVKDNISELRRQSGSGGFFGGTTPRNEVMVQELTAKRDEVYEQMIRTQDKTQKTRLQKLVRDLDEQIRSFNPPATAKTTDLVEEAKKSKIPLTAQMSKKDETLAVLHNLNAENIAFADEIGGLPNPSVAVVKPSLNNFDNFGEISLIADSDFLFSGKGKTFGADVYSPRFPQVETYTTDYDKFKSTMSKYLGDKFVDEGDFYRVAKNDPAFVKAFEDNLKLPKRERIEEFGLFIESIAEEAGIKKRIFDGFTPSGNRKYLKVEAESISKSMSKADQRGGETMFYGLPSIRSLVAPQFRSTSAIKKAQDRIVSSELFTGVTEQYEKQLSSLMDDVMPYYKYDKESFGSMDDVGRGLGEYYSGKTSVLDELFDDLPQDVKEKIDLFGMELSQMPTEYFETKFNRVVDLDEFSHAVIPEDTPKSVKDTLKKKGIEYTEYKKGDGNQSETVRKVLLEKGLLFGLGAFVYVETQE